MTAADAGLRDERLRDERLGDDARDSGRAGGFPLGTLAVITGAAGGIGRAVALRLVASGARLALIDLDGDGLEEAVRAVRASGAEAEGFVADVADEAAMAQAAAAVEARFGDCAVLVNNAGVLLRGRFFDEDAPAQWARTIDINLGGAFFASRAFLPALRATRGCIVNVASVHSFSAVGNSAAYTASKGGLKQFTQALAVELAADGIRVNAVAPGAVRTGMTGEAADLEGPSGFLARVPLRRLGEPDEVAHAVHFLASAQASYITGITLPVDGGYLAG